MTPAGFDAISKIISAAWPSFPFGADTQAVYKASLADLEDRPVAEAVKKLIATSEYAPTVAAIRKLAKPARSSAGVNGAYLIAGSPEWRDYHGWEKKAPRLNGVSRIDPGELLGEGGPL